MKPPASQYATAISHGISLEKAEKACGKVSTLVSIATPRPSMATAPSGSGVVMMPAMVPVKTASRCHACGVTPAGAGANHSAMPTPMQMDRSFMLAPHLKGAAGGAAADEAETATERRAARAGSTGVARRAATAAGRATAWRAAAMAAGAGATRLPELARTAMRSGAAPIARPAPSAGPPS